MIITFDTIVTLFFISILRIKVENQIQLFNIMNLISVAYGALTKCNQALQ